MDSQVKIIVFGMLGLFAIIGLILIIRGIFFSVGNGPPWFFGVFILAIVGWNSYWTFSFPHRITLSRSGELTFIGLLRKRQISVAEIVSIKPDPTQIFGFLIVRTNNKKIKILNQFDGFHDLIFNLKSTKPAIELRGC